jgi:hypothetical protein
MSDKNIPLVYLDSSTNYTAWLLERILEDRAESAPIPGDGEGSDE